MDNRRDDWHNSVDERLVNLTSAQKTADTDLDDLRMELLRVDHILRGDLALNQEGLLEAIHQIQKEISKFNAVLGPDHLGQGGLLNDIRELMGNRSRREKREGYYWTFFTAVAVQFLILIGLLVVNWDRIMLLVRSSAYKPSTQMQGEIEADKKQTRARARKAAARKAQRANDESAAEGLSEVQATDGVH